MKGLSLLAGAFFAIAVSPANAAVLEITFPATGAVVNDGTLISAELDESIDRDTIAAVVFQYSPDGVAWQTIRGAGPKGFGEFNALWNTFGLGGTFQVRAVMTERNNIVTISPTVTLFVNRQPVARATVTPTAQPYKVRYDATASSDPDGSVRRYEWSFGDGTKATGPVVEHQFPGPGSFGVGLTVTDNRGGSTARHTILAIASQGFLKEKEKNTCGCEKMDVKNTGEVEGPADLRFSGLVPGEARKLGRYNDGEAGDQLDFTRFDLFQVKHRFEVVAELTPKSKPQLCEEGQRVQASDRDAKGVNTPWRGFRTSDPRYDYRPTPPMRGFNPDDPFDPNDDPKVLEMGPCGYNAGTWCDDDYHGGGGPRGNGSGDQDPPNRNKRYIGQEKIVWIDPPGIRNLSETQLKAVGYLSQNKFEAIVAGPGGTCKCTWEIIIEIDKTGKVIKNDLEKKDCTQ